jgi:serine/threonine protein kinase
LLAHDEAADDFLDRPSVRLPDLMTALPEPCRVFQPEYVIKGRFRVIGHLASGGMSEVHRARDLHLQRDVAIEVVPNLVAHASDRV